MNYIYIQIKFYMILINKELIFYIKKSPTELKYITDLFNNIIY